MLLVALSGATFILINILEHFYYFEPGVRKVMFSSFVGISLLAFAWWVLLPLLHYFRLGRLISHEQAAEIIGNHFADVKDKLLNILQLKKMAGGSTDAALIMAGINQKTEDIKWVPFRRAINLSENKRYFIFVLPPLLVLGALLISSDLIENSTTRLVQSNKHFERPMPFHFNIINQEELEVIQFGDFKLEVQTTGQFIPNDAYIIVDDYRYRLQRDQHDRSRFYYTFKNVQRDIPFRFESGIVRSAPSMLEVIMKPTIAGFATRLEFPAYTGLKPETLRQTGDLQVPAGTKVFWDIKTDFSEQLFVRFGPENDSIQSLSRSAPDTYTMSKRFLANERYTLFTSSKKLPLADSVSYSISVVPDEHPKIQVEEFIDSMDNRLRFHIGEVSDDYGIRRVTFNYSINNEDQRGEVITEPVLSASGRAAAFDYVFNIRNLELKPGDNVVYFFEVFDNDGVNGSKSTRSQIMSYRMPTLEEWREQEEENQESIKRNLDEGKKEISDIRQQTREYRERLLQKEEIDWQDRKELERLLEQRRQMERNIQESKDLFRQNLEQQRDYEQPRPDILEKQEKLQELMEQLMDDELRELLKKMEELLHEMNRDDLLDNLMELELNEQELVKELDRMMELFKQLELEHEMNKAIDDLQKLAEEQQQLSEDTKSGEHSKEELMERQKEIEQKFEQIQERLDNIEQKNQELESPHNLGNLNEQSDGVMEDMQQGMQQLQQNNQDGASEKQQDASDKMKDMAQNMSNMMQASSMAQMMEDMESLRQILDNLIRLSFDQEDIMEDIKVTTINTPEYVRLVREQFRLKDDFRIVEDSLHALSKRVFQIESFINDKVTDVKRNFDQAIYQLEERVVNRGTGHQHAAMTALNDLALMLSEVMQQMQQQMAGNMSGDQMCQSPGGQGGGNPRPNLGQMQQQLNQQLQQMQQGQSPGGQDGMSRQFAEMARRQAAIRRALEQLQQEKRQRGQGDQELQDLIDEMDKTETDLVNKRITREMMKRQEEILTRLLESERAEREREYEEQRESEIAREYERKMPPELEEYLKQRRSEIDEIRRVSPALRPYYKNLVESYQNAARGTR